MENSRIYDDLHSRVVNGEFLPEQRLSADKLRADYDCSASTLREILFRLSTVGLVDFQEQKGFRLPAQSRELQHDLAQFRIFLECQGACLSIRLGGVAWEARLSAAHHKLSHIETRVHSGQKTPELLTLWTAAELEFHQTLIDACGSPTLQQTHSVIYQQFRQQMISSDREFVFISENVDQHKAILDAAISHDEDLTCDRIISHLSRNLIRPIPDKMPKIL